MCISVADLIYQTLFQVIIKQLWSNRFLDSFFFNTIDECWVYLLDGVW